MRPNALRNFLKREEPRFQRTSDCIFDANETWCVQMTLAWVKSASRCSWIWKRGRILLDVKHDSILDAARCITEDQCGQKCLELDTSVLVKQLNAGWYSSENTFMWYLVRLYRLRLFMWRWESLETSNNAFARLLVCLNDINTEIGWPQWEYVRGKMLRYVYMYWFSDQSLMRSL